MIKTGVELKAHSVKTQTQQMISGGYTSTGHFAHHEIHITVNEIICQKAIPPN